TGSRWRSMAGRTSLRDLKLTRIKEAENKISRREVVERVLQEKARQPAAKEFSAENVSVPQKTHYLKTAFIDQLRPLDTEICLADISAVSATVCNGGNGSGSGSTPVPSDSNKDKLVANSGSDLELDLTSSASLSAALVEKPRISIRRFMEKAFTKPITDDLLNALVTGFVRKSHILLYAEDPWSEGYSLPLLVDISAQMGAQVTAIDIPDWAVLTSRIDPLFEDLTIVSHPYSPPPDLDVDGGSGNESGARGMAFFAGINRKRQNDDGDSMNEQMMPSDTKDAAASRAKDKDNVDEGVAGAEGKSFDRSIDSIWPRFTRGRGQNSDRLDAEENEEEGDPALSKEMMSNPLSREATEKLDRALEEFVSTPALVDGLERPRIIALKHMGDLMNTRIGYTVFSRLVSAVSRHNSRAGAVPVMLVGLLHPSWFNSDVPPPGIPPYDVNPATPVALMPAEDRLESISRGANGIIEGLLGDNANRAAGGKLGVHVVQMDEMGPAGRISRALGGASLVSARGTGKGLAELPLFARMGIPPMSQSIASTICDMQTPDYARLAGSTSTTSLQMVGSLRQALVADQCLERNARVIRNICLLYQVPGLELNEKEAEHLAVLASTKPTTRFLREGLYNESVGLPKQPRRNIWNLDHRPLTVMLRSLPDDVGRRFFFGETFLHRWISLAQALAVREQLSLDAIKQNPAVLSDFAQTALLGSHHLTQAWTQLLESYVALHNGVVAYDNADGLAQDNSKQSVIESNKTTETSTSGSILSLHRQVDFGNIGIGRKAQDDTEWNLCAAFKTMAEDSSSSAADREEQATSGSAKAKDSKVDRPKQWVDVSHELEAEDSDMYDEELSGDGRVQGTQSTAQKRIQMAKKNLTEYEQRLVGSIVDPQSIPTGFSQVCVKPETVTTLQEIITLPMLRPEYFSKGVLRRYGVSGILLFGPPGTGKTMLAKAVAKESGSVVLNIRASDIYDKYVGEGEKLAEAVFTLARKLAPCVIFIDEVDALFSARSSGEANKFRRDIMNQIMSEWDGLNTMRKKGAASAGLTGGGPATQVMVMAATNRPFDLDDAILRRLPRRILVDLPGPEDRERILKIHLAGEDLCSDVDLTALSKRTESFSGSDLKNLCVATALAALRERVKQEVGTQDDTQGLSLIERLRDSRKLAQSAAGHRMEQIRLGARHFDSALKSVAPSSSDRMESLIELRKWDKLYGDGAQERGRKQLSIGFGAAAAGVPAITAADSNSKDSSTRVCSITRRLFYPLVGGLIGIAVYLNFGVGSSSVAGTAIVETMAAASAKIEWADMMIVSGVVVGAATFLFRKALFGKGKTMDQSAAYRDATIAAAAAAAATGSGAGSKGEYNEARDFVAKMRRAGKNVVVFYGSQTGTAEDFATRLAKDMQSGGVRPLVLDPESYDWQCLAGLGEGELAVFVLATSGEGEPTDNMEAWFDALASDRENPEDSDIPEFHQPEDKDGLDPDMPLNGVSYAVFGLGNNTYEQFNHHARVVDGRLRALGASRIGERGEGDDDVDIEEDFAKWKAATLPLIREHLGASDDDGQTQVPQPTWAVAEIEIDAAKVWTRGETGDGIASEGSVVAYSIHRPFAAPIIAATDLTPSGDRHVLHIEVDLSGSGMRYEAGDHIGVFAANSDAEVDLMLHALSLQDRADAPISVRATDPFAAQQTLFPGAATTYRAAFRHYLDIAAPVPRSQIASLVLPHARSAAAREFLGPLANNKDKHAAVVTAGCLTPARLLLSVQQAEAAAGVPETERLSLPVAEAFELCQRMQARLYSISSSARVTPTRASITAVVLQYDAQTELASRLPLGARRCGVATNYLLAALDKLSSGSPDPEVCSAADALMQPPILNSKDHVIRSYAVLPPTLPVFIRRSTFRLPSDATTPIIMVGPGTGLAPMRAFVQERALFARETPENPQGTSLLFFGARTNAHDFIYREELILLFDDIRKVAPESRIITAFSRDQKRKIYVQHRLAENAELVYRTLLCGKDKLNGPSRAHIYVCGDAKMMAKDVARALITLIAEREGVSEETAAKWVSEMRRLSRYQEDVWS
ncbi:hypothetical protein FB639_000529, partial [Coemansia asiatica]